MDAKLKIKLNVFEKRLAMQVIDQDKSLIGSISKPIEFKSSNGIVIVSSNRPGLYPELKEVCLRGQDNSSDLDIVYGKFQSNEDAEKFLLELEVALTEFIDKINEDYLIKLSGMYNEPIDLGTAVVSFSPINNGFVMELLKSNVENPNDNIINHDGFNVEFINDSVKIYLPFNTDESFQCLINKKFINKDNFRDYILKIIKVLYNKTKVTNNSNYSDKMYVA